MSSETAATNEHPEPQCHPLSVTNLPITSPEKICQENEFKYGNSQTGNKLDMYCVLKEPLLKAFAMVGAIRRVYNVHEVLDLLKRYLSKNASLIDSQDPKVINCANTDLGEAFEVDKFEYKDVGKLLAKNVIKVDSAEVTLAYNNYRLKSKEFLDTDSCNKDSISTCDTGSKTSSFTYSCNSVGSSHCNSSASVPSTSCSSQNFRKFNTCKIHVPEIPDCLTGPESEHSYQGYETAVIDDSDSDRHSTEEVEEQVEEEFELASDSEADSKSQNDTESDFENFLLILGVEERENSDEDCFADHSSSSSSESDGHSTEDEKDQWSCVTCGIKNKPFMRYCLKCWQLRKDWYPDPPKRLRKRKPRTKKDKKRLSCESDEKANGKDEGEEPTKEIFTEALVRTGSTASTSTVDSVCSSSTSSTITSQDSGFGSQDLSSLEVYIPRKRKLSEGDERKCKVQKITDNDDVEEMADKFAKKFRKFSKTSKGIRWLKSEAAKELLELMQDVSSDSDFETSDAQDVCTLCYSRPKDASIIHGRLSHIGFCYPCAKRLYNSKSKCPICRRKIHMITKNAYV